MKQVINKKLCYQINLFFCHAICHDSVVWQTKEQRTNLAWWPDNHYSVICFPVFSDQHNHGMCHNSIILQTVEVTDSSWFDQIIPTMLSFTTVFCNKHRSKWPFRRVWDAKHSREWSAQIRVTTSLCCLSWQYCITNIGVWAIITFTLGWYDQVITTLLSAMMVYQQPYVMMANISYNAPFFGILNTKHWRTWAVDITGVTKLNVTIVQCDKHWGKWPT